MATVSAIPEKTQTKTAMGKVMRYVAQEKKTLFSDGEKSYQLISGQNCVAETAYQEFMATKKQYGKDNGVFFKQFVQSFKPNEKATPQEIHQMGVEFAKYFDGFEVLIATHIDKDHHHNHLIVNSVSYETGLKIQFNEKNLKELRNKSDEICKTFGLEVLASYQKPKVAGINSREYRAALRGDSWKFTLMNVIDHAMTASRNKQEFIGNMGKLGYGVKWIDHYKNITYTLPDGKTKCCDDKLHDEKYLKVQMEDFYKSLVAGTQIKNTSEPSVRSASAGSALEEFFDVRYKQAQGTAPIATIADAALSVADGSRAGGFMEIPDTVSSQGGRISDRYEQGDIRTSDLERYLRRADDGNEASQSDDRTGYFEQPQQNRRYDIEADEGYGEQYDLEDADDITGYDGTDESEGFIPVEAPSEVGADWLDIAGGALYLAKSIENLVNPPENNRQKKKKYVPNSEETKKKNQALGIKDSHEMSM
ncbi:MAG: relaxase/mobilization nuclease domain-containing protein [Firmicutes bacterium]|nr:relaxase/mobilization nuclease domain-containing protein [Bacillota bacterium]